MIEAIFARELHLTDEEKDIAVITVRNYVRNNGLPLGAAYGELWLGGRDRLGFAATCDSAGRLVSMWVLTNAQLDEFTALARKHAN